MTVRSDPRGGPPSTGDGLVIHPLIAGHVSVRQRQVRGAGSGGMRRLNVLRDKTWTSPLPILAWAIEHPEGLIVVDTGEVSEGTDPKHYPASNPYLRRATRFEVSREDEIDRQLTRLGLSSDQARWVVLTNLHTDHAGGLGHFRDAEVIVSSDEWRAARGLAGRFRGYLPQHFPSCLRPRTISFRNEPVGPFARSWPLTDAGDVLLLPTRGHTYGHLSVLIRRVDRPTVLLAGDASYRQDLMLEGAIDGVAVDEKAAVDTLKRLRTFVLEQPTVYLPAHDPDSGARFANGSVVEV